MISKQEQFQAICRVAAKRARRAGEVRYVVYVPEDEDHFEGPYAVCSEHGVDTYYAGSQILYAVGPDGCED